MNTINIDLIGDSAINIGATYKVQMQLCNAPDLTMYAGVSQIKQSNTSTDIVMAFTVNVLSKDIFELVLPHTAFTPTVLPGNYQYDVLFYKSDNRFYPVSGKVALIKRITQML